MKKMLIGLILLGTFTAIAQEKKDDRCRLDVVMDIQLQPKVDEAIEKAMINNDQAKIKEIMEPIGKLANLVCR